MWQKINTQLGRFRSTTTVCILAVAIAYIALHIVADWRIRNDVPSENYRNFIESMIEKMAVIDDVEKEHIRRHFLNSDSRDRSTHIGAFRDKESKFKTPFGGAVFLQISNVATESRIIVVARAKYSRFTTEELFECAFENFKPDEKGVQRGQLGGTQGSGGLMVDVTFKPTTHGDTTTISYSATAAGHGVTLTSLGACLLAQGNVQRMNHISEVASLAPRKEMP